MDMVEGQKELTALVVDDNEGLREALVEILSSFPNLNIQTAVNGQDAYTKIKEQKPDILYTDIVMPKMWGDNLLKKLVEEGIKIPTFVMSSDLDDSVGSGANAVFYSQRMYTNEQREALNLPIQPDIEAQKVYMSRQPHVTKIEGGVVTFKGYDFGFTAITKPLELNDIIKRTDTVLKMFYGIDTNLQS